jgi:hypothetical protein
MNLEEIKNRILQEQDRAYNLYLSDAEICAVASEDIERIFNELESVPAETVVMKTFMEILLEKDCFCKTDGSERLYSYSEIEDAFNEYKASIPAETLIRRGRSLPDVACGLYKKFIVFEYETYYPGGGVSDIKGSFDDLEEAKQFILKEPTDYNYVIDRDTWEKVYEL